MRSETVGQCEVPDVDGREDPRVAELRAAVTRLRAELDDYPAQLRDRRTAEDELDTLAALVGTGAPPAAGLCRSLLLIAAAVGSVSALRAALADLRNAVELFGEPRPVQRVN
ncbi:MAG: DUF5955 family protein [Streptomyces sp.]|uniref:DUF5955 family protein n=1 Tax=Streptomyces sp. TaxID=1931 RepID=UPI003D6BAD3D